MDSLSIYTKLNNLPDAMKAEVADFIEFLENKAKKQSKAIATKPKFGSAKDMFVMHEDFDEPLEDFKDYME